MRPYFFCVMLHYKSAAAALQIYRTSEVAEEGQR